MMVLLPCHHVSVCHLCVRRPLTYRFLSYVHHQSRADSPLPIPPSHGRLHGSHCPSSCVTGTGCTRAYSVKKRPEEKQVYRNPKLGYVWYRELAAFIREKVWPGDSLKKEKALVLDSNAGPGVLTKELLSAGARRVVSIDKNREFLPQLKKLQEGSDGRLLQVLHADFYKMQYHGSTPYPPPVVRVKELFEHVTPVSWESDCPIKVIGCFPYRTEKTQAYLFASLMLERLSIYAYGRAQFNFLLSQKCYDTITQMPGSYFNYRAISALYQLGFDIELLHKEPLSSFTSPSAPRDRSCPEYFCLTRLTPKRDLFVRHNLSQHQAFLFVYFMRQSLSKRRQKLAEVIEKWAPGHSHIVEELGLRRNIRTGDVEGDILLKIFMMICDQDTFNGSWMGEDALTIAQKAIPTAS